MVTPFMVLYVNLYSNFVDIFPMQGIAASTTLPAGTGLVAYTPQGNCVSVAGLCPSHTQTG